MKRRILALLMVAVMLFSMAACAEPSNGNNQLLKDGTYKEVAEGNNGDVEVTMVIKNGVIDSVKVTKHQESAGISDVAISRIPELIAEHQTVNVDTVSGATNSSVAILNAAKACIEKAGGNIDDWMTPIAKESSSGETTELNCDVLVIGAGLTGLTSALSAAQNGADVLVLEKQAMAGGSCVLSTGIIQAAGSKLQKQNGIDDSPEKYYDDMMKLTEGKREKAQVDMVTKHSGETIDWLMDNGVEFYDKVIQGVGSTAFRAHVTSPDASGLVKGLVNSLDKAGVDIMLETPVKEFIQNADGRITGAKAVDKEGNEIIVHAKNTVLASGGYTANTEMLAKYWGEEYANAIYGSSPGVTGEMIEAAEAAGAKLVGMDVVIPGSPSVDTEKHQVVTTLTLSGGGIFVNTDGERFCNETADGWAITSSVRNAGDYVYEIFDSTVRQDVYKVESYIKQGIVGEAATIEELSEKISVPVENLKATIDAYNTAAKGNAPDPLGREMFVKPMENPPYYYIKVTSGLVLTHGGVVINEKGQVLKEDGSVLEGLYAGGECTGGYRAFGYVCGDANAHAAVTGKIAGENAAKSATVE
jgi:flavocytochrome c